MFCLLETRLRGLDSRTRIQERLSRIKSPRNHAVSPESLGASRLPSFGRTACPGRSLFFSALLSEPHLPRPEGCAQTGVGCGAAAAAVVGPAGQSRPEAEAGTAPSKLRPAPWPDLQREGSLHLQTPLFDRQASRYAEPAGAARSGDDVQLSARTAGVAGLRGSPCRLVREAAE